MYVQLEDLFGARRSEEEGDMVGCAAANRTAIVPCTSPVAHFILRSIIFPSTFLDCAERTLYRDNIQISVDHGLGKPPVTLAALRECVDGLLWSKVVKQ